MKECLVRKEEGTCEVPLTGANKNTGFLECDHPNCMMCPDGISEQSANGYNFNGCRTGFYRSRYRKCTDKIEGSYTHTGMRTGLTGQRERIHTQVNALD
ncbi:hypothetical protein MAR_032872 [Mya arenaria]|uniref:Uncharacterized protein n=1 Tax=Mya arenaria TaxID=6604 RepID=A0ABY7G8A1_MYAAR|nr:hypothetical protein MAR_032872 [Mya arenaria]